MYDFYIYDPSFVYVDDDFTSSTSGWGYDHFDSIQDGIDAVVGSMVYVYNGTYNEQVRFNLLTTGVRDRRQFPITPETYGLVPVDLERLKRTLPAGPDGVDPLAGLKATADQVVANALVTDGDPIKVAEALEAFFQQTGGFQYSLEPQERAAGVDPIE